jgi:hypothetical protein
MTSIEWLENKLDYILPLEFEWDRLEKIFEEAKEMHKQEIIDAYKVGNNDYANFIYVATSGDDYYDVTFKK